MDPHHDPELEPQPQDLDQTVEDLRLKLETLEKMVFSTPTYPSSSSRRVRTIFTPTSSHQTEIDKLAPFGETPEGPTESQIYTKLPNFETPKFDGHDLEGFLKKLGSFFPAY